MKKYFFLLSLTFLIISCGSDIDGISPKEYVEQNNLNAIELENGIYIQIDEPGDDRRVKSDEVVLVDYRGILANTGETFIDEVDIASFYGSFLSGWQIGLQEIGIGGSCTLVLPPDQAFGQREFTGVPAKSTVVFEITMKEILTTATVDEYIARNNLTTIELEKGVHIVILEPGNDVKPTINSDMKVNYKGKLTNELIFDQADDIVLNLSGLIEGWKIGLPQIGEGGKCILIMPAEVGYGATGAGNGAVPPDSPLVFEIDLIEVGSKADDYVEENNLDTEILEAGVHIIIDEEGDVDKKPDLNSIVKVNYEGRLEDGTVFDSGEGTTFQLSGLIKGWQIGLQEIGEGGSCTLIIPPTSGYGSNQNGSIPPNSVLIFDIELLTVN